MLPNHKKIVQATVPVLQQYGEAITQVFYQQLLATHPELSNLFNPANQRNGAGTQPRGFDPGVCGPY